MDSPIVLLSRGGGGSRLLSVLGVEAGIFLGNSLNISGDSLEMVESVYKVVVEKCQSGAERRPTSAAAELRAGARAMLEKAGFPTPWGFKLPEALLIVAELAESFPEARFAHMIRDPLATCLRRTHLTARLDNPIGQVTLPLAYRYHGLPLTRIAQDSPALHMAYTTMQQLESALDFCRALPRERYFELRFEDLVSDPGGTRRRFEHWLERNPVRRFQSSIRAAWGRMRGRTGALESAVDPGRAAQPSVSYPPEIEAQVAEVLSDLRVRLGYAERESGPAWA